MSETEYEHRYIFTVRQQFGEEPRLDSFYKLKIPDGITSSQVDMLRTLHPNWCRKEIEEDSSVYRGMEFRLRFNTDMYQRICLVKTNTELSAGELNTLLKQKHEEGTLREFLDKAAI